MYCIPHANILCGGGGEYFGLGVVMQRPQTLHHSHNNLHDHYRIASIFYV